MAIPEDDPVPAGANVSAIVEGEGVESLKAAAAATQDIAIVEAPPEA